MGKSTISMVIFNSYVTNYQRVAYLNGGFNGNIIQRPFQDPIDGGTDSIYKAYF